MFRRALLLLNDMSSVGGGPVLGLRSGYKKGPGMIQPTVVDAAIDQAALELKMSSLLAREMATSGNGGEEEKITPPLKRAWVRAPISQLSTSISRRDWFRLMSFNMMTDAWGPARTTPVAAVRVRVPDFTRDISMDANEGSSNSADTSSISSSPSTDRSTENDKSVTSQTSASEGGFYDYDPSDPNAELPPFLTSEFRRKHLVTLLRSYDPDIVCLNEVNRTFFNTDMWKYVRFLGYGTLYQSSRGARVEVRRRGADATVKSNQNKIAEEEDIGNVLFFHKGRFFPLMMPGRDIGRHFHFAHFVGMRDKVTNMTLYVACVQLTAGDSDEAVAVRTHEARQVLTLLEAMARNDTDRAHLTSVICGDLNNHRDDEPCVELLRNKFFSAHDLIGGPRWTAWHYRDTKRAPDYDTYFAKNVAEMHRFDGMYTAEEEIQRFRRADNCYHGKSSKVQLVREEIRQKANAATPTKPTGAAPSTPSAQTPTEAAAATGAESTTAGSTANPATDQLALVKEVRNAKGITFNTQDFIFYDPNSLALHQVLDVPEDTEVDEGQLFPNHKLPSHHLPLVIDLSWNDTFPDVLATSLKE